MNQSIIVAAAQSQAPKGFGARDYVSQSGVSTRTRPIVAVVRVACANLAQAPGSRGASGDRLAGPHLLGVDLGEGRALVETGGLALRRVLLGNRELRRCPAP